MSKGISVDNFDVVKKHLRDELKILGSKLEKSILTMRSSENVVATDLIKLEQMKEMVETLMKMYDSFAKNMELKPVINVTTPDVNIPEIKLPTINVPEIRIPDFKIPTPEVTVNNEFDVQALLRALEPLNLLSNKATSPLSVRLSDGKKFIEALTKAAGEISDSAERMGVVFAGGGLSDVTVKNTASNPVPVTGSLSLSASSISTASLSNVGDSATSVSLLASNTSRKGFIIFNDSSAILYIKLGTTASTSSFTYKLNAYGTVNETNFPYTGAIDGIWASDAGGNARITELS